MHQTSLRQDIAQVAASLEKLTCGEEPPCLLILGSGLNFFGDCLEDPTYLSYDQVPGLGTCSAEGHLSRFVWGRVPGTKRRVLAMQGRFHGYEGYASAQVALPVWAAHGVGAKILVTTNAAGAINPSFGVGDFCLMTDQMNLTGRNPLQGDEPNELANRFVPMNQAFSPRLADLARRAARAERAKDAGVVLQEGVYAALSGPSYETPAEIRALGILGADTVAMSVAEEVIAARHVSMEVLGISLISNMACGVAGGNPSSQEVAESGLQAQDRFSVLMEGVLTQLAS